MRHYIKAAIVVAVLVVLYVTLPYFFGTSTKRYITRFSQNESATLGNVFATQLVVKNYRCGWFHSTATLLFQKKVNGVFQDVKSIPIKITNGPFYKFNNRFTAGLGLVQSDGSLTDASSPYMVLYQENISFDGEHKQFVLVTSKADQPTSTMPSVKSLLIRVKSDHAAENFMINIDAAGLQFADAAKSMNAGIDTLSVQLKANYLDNQQWNLILGFNIGKNQLGFPVTINQQPQPLTVQSDQIQLANLHINTAEIASLLTQIAQLKQANTQAAANNQPANPAAWLFLVQNTVAQMIQPDTQFKINGFKVTSPLGAFNMRYTMGFPSLTVPHDYFDLAMRAVGAVNITVPSFKLTNDKSQSSISLTNLTYNANYNTIFSHDSEMAFDTFNIDSTNPMANATTIAATGFLYHATTQGDAQRLTQDMQWSLSKICVSANCFSNIKNDLNIANLNPKAFRGIAAATTQLMQYHPPQMQLMLAQWMDLVNAYSKLISPKTTITVSHILTSPQGNITVQGSVNWPNLSPSQTGMADLAAQANYQLHVVFPQAYITDLLNFAKSTATTSAPVQNGPELMIAKQAATWIDYLIQNNYVTLANNAYTADLKGQGPVMTLNGKAWVAPAKPAEPVPVQQTSAPAAQPVAPGVPMNAPAPAVQIAPAQVNIH